MGTSHPTQRTAAHFRDDILRDLSRRQFDCPTFIDAAMSVRLALKKRDMSNAELARVVSAEPMLSVRIVALANSAALSARGRRTTDVKSAVNHVGQNAVHNLAMALTLKQIAMARELQPFRSKSEEIWAHRCGSAFQSLNE